MQNLRLDRRTNILLFDFRGKSLELGFGSRDEEEVETFLCELNGVFFSESVRCTRMRIDGSRANVGSSITQIPDILL